MNSFPFSRGWLKQFQGAPIHLLDVGGAGGIQGRWKEILPFIRAYLFEPDVRSFEKLKEAHKNIFYVNAALGSCRESRTLNLTREPQCSSMYEPNAALFSQFPIGELMEVVNRIPMEVVPLDTLQAEGTLPRIDFMKVDAQGFELEILKGATTIVEQQVLGLEIEVEFMPLYSGQSLFCDVHGLMISNDFELMDLRGAYWKRKGPVQFRQSKGQMIYADALYMRTLGSIRARMAASDAAEARAVAMRSVGINILYNYYDRAYDILQFRPDLFTNEERADIQKFFSTSFAPMQFFRRMKIYMALQRLADFFDPGRGAHFTISPQIGNIVEL